MVGLIPFVHRDRHLPSKQYRTTTYVYHGRVISEQGGSFHIRGCQRICIGGILLLYRHTSTVSRTSDLTRTTK